MWRCGLILKLQVDVFQLKVQLDTLYFEYSLRLHVLRVWFDDSLCQCIKLMTSCNFDLMFPSTSLIVVIGHPLAHFSHAELWSLSAVRVPHGNIALEGWNQAMFPILCCVCFAKQILNRNINTCASPFRHLHACGKRGEWRPESTLIGLQPKS